MDDTNIGVELIYLRIILGIVRLALNAPKSLKPCSVNVIMITF